MDRFVSEFHRRALGALALAAVLLLVRSSPAQAQSNPFCGNHVCLVIICYTASNGVTICIPILPGCYSTAPNLGHCQCPLGSSTCVPASQALTGENGPPSDQQLVDEGFGVCHELVRERMGADRKVVLFDKETAPAVLTGPNRVGVTGFAHPRAAVLAQDPQGPLDLGREPEGEPVGRRFDCEVERNEKGYWTPLAMTLAEDQK